MSKLFLQLHQDEAGFIVSGELVLISTVLVLGMIVGLSEVAHGINQELEDVGSAFGAVNQSYRYDGFTGHKGFASGSSLVDEEDFCDSQDDIVCDSSPTNESPAY